MDLVFIFNLMTCICCHGNYDLRGWLGVFLFCFFFKEKEEKPDGRATLCGAVKESIQVVLVMMAFSSLAKTLGEGLKSRCPPADFFFFFRSEDQLMHTSFTCLDQDPSTVAQRAEMIVAACSLTSCVSSFPWHVSTLCLDSIVSPLRLRWVNGVCLFRYNPPPALLPEWPGSFTCYLIRFNPWTFVHLDGERKEDGDIVIFVVRCSCSEDLSMGS